MRQVSISTVSTATTDTSITHFNQYIDANITSNTRITTQLIAPGQLFVDFSDDLSDADITVVNDAITICLVIPPSFTRVRGYSTGKLTIKNTAYTVLDKVIFQGRSPLRFSINSYTTTQNINYSVRFVNSKTKEVISEATFNNISTDDVMSTGVYTGVIPENMPIVVEIQGKIENSSARAYIDSIVVDYN